MDTLAQFNMATTKQLKNLLSTITYLQNQVFTLSTCPPHPGHDNNNNRNTDGSRKKQRKVHLYLINADGTQTYCWLHGGSISATQNIINCNHTLPGHKNAATFAN